MKKMKKAILIFGMMFWSISVINIQAAPTVSIISGPTNDLVTNQPFSVTLSVDEDFGYWSTNGSAFHQFAAGTTPMLNVNGNSMILKYYGKDFLNNTSVTQSICYSWGTPGLAFSLNGNEYSVSKGTANTSETIVIPSIYKGFPVTVIAGQAFLLCKQLPSVIIPDSIITIGGSAFNACNGLTNVLLSANLVSIGDTAFNGCGFLSIKIPNTVTTIGNYAFSGCNKLLSIEIPESVNFIGDQSFARCLELTNITVDAANNFYRSRDGVLFNKNGTILICCPSGKTGVYAIPNSVITINSYAFLFCNRLTNILIPNSVTSIGGGAFSQCSVLSNIVIPNSVTSIGAGTFSFCSGLISVTIPDSVTSIGYAAFQFCSGLASIVIPNSVTSIGSSAFSQCSGLANITIPNSVVSIGNESTFAGCSSLKNITIPNRVTSIGKGLFFRCVGLTNVIIPNSVTSIGDSAFYQCSGLAGISIPNSVTSIGEGAFYYCFGLASITIPNSVTSIGNYGFYYCMHLTNIILLNETPPSIDSYFFYQCSALSKIYVPSETAVTAYKAAPNWSTYSSIIFAMPTPAPHVSIISGPTNDLVTNQPFSVTLSVDEDFGYWSTNGSAFQQFAAGTTPIILIGKTTTLKYYGQDVLNNTSSTQTKNYAINIASPKMIFWNRLGFEYEVQNSEVGVNGNIAGSAEYGPVQFGDGVSFADQSSWAAFDGLFGNENYSAWTIEGWVKLETAYSPGYGSAANPCWFSGQASQSGGLSLFPNFYIVADHQGSGNGYLDSINMTIQESAEKNMTYIWYFPSNQYVPGQIFHATFTVDLDKPVGEKCKIFINGIEPVMTSITKYDTAASGHPLTSFQFPAYCQIGQRNFSADWVASDRIDNLKIYNYAKTNFADRFFEGTNGNASPVVAISQPDGVSDAADLSYTIKYTLTDPDDNATVSLYYSTNNSGFNGTLIAAGLPESADGSYIWNTAAISNGSYYVYAIAEDGVNSPVRVYSSGKLIIRHGIPGAVYVSVTGSDLNPGTIDLPFRTIQKGIDSAQNLSFSNVFVSEGDYQSYLNISGRINLCGGYSSNFLNRDLNCIRYLTKVQSYGGDGISVQSSKLVSINGFVIAHCYYGIVCYTSGVIIAHNLINNNSCGVFAEGNVNITIISNKIYNSYEGIHGNLITANYNILSNNNTGISGSGKFYYNHIKNNNTGIYGWGQLLYNYIINNTIGIVCRGGAVYSNSISKNSIGIKCWGNIAQIGYNNITFNTNQAISVDGFSSLLIYNNTIESNNSLYFSSIGQGIIYNNYIRNNNFAVADIFFSGTKLFFVNNLIYGSGFRSFDLNLVSSFFYNNVFIPATNSLVIFNDGETHLSNNIFLNTSCTYISNSSYKAINQNQLNSLPNGASGNNIVADPQLLADGITPSLTSRCINNGLDPRLYIPALTNDYFGNPRPSPAGGQFDIGAVEVPNANAVPYINIIQPATNIAVDSSCTIEYELADPDDNATVSLYYSTNNSGYDGTLITSGLAESADGSYIWNTAALSNGSYYVYAVAEDGVNPAVKVYSSGDVRVNHSGLILWNKLGSASEIQNSEIGVNGMPYGTIDYLAGQFGNGASFNANGDQIDFLDPSASLTPSAGCLSVWVKPNGWGTLNGVVSDGDWKWIWQSCIYNPGPIEKYEFDFGFAPTGGMMWRIYNNNQYYHPATCFLVPGLNLTDGKNSHLAFVWSESGIGGTADTLRIYMDGNQLWSYQGILDMPSITNGPFRLGNASVNYYSGIGMNDFGGVLDNLKVYNYAKTNFSDRCSEDGSTTCPEAQRIKLLYPADQLSLSDTTPTFKWEVPQSLDNKNLHFILEVSENSSFTSSLVFDSSLLAAGFNPRPPVRPGVGTQYFTLLKALKKSVTYYWRVKAWSNPGSYFFSDERRFIIR